MYTSEKRGNDETGTGAKAAPFKTILRAMKEAAKEPFPPIYVDSKDAKAADGEYELAAKSQLKKVQKIWMRESNKNAVQAQRLEGDAKKREQNLEEAKKVVISEDPSWPKAIRVRIEEGQKNRGVRVRLYGWVHRLRRQGKGLMFITLRDGTGFLQCVLTDSLCQTYDALVLSTESTVQLFGTLKVVPEGKTVSD